MNLSEYFDFQKHGTNLRTEILAGVSTFLALSYIFVVNPAILSEAGMSKSAVFFATVMVSALATILMGLWANKPFSLAPGLEMNAFIAFVVVGTMGFAWQDALGAVFWSGVIMILVNYARLRESIIKAIPDKMKSGLAASVGVFLILIALNVSGVLAYEGIQLRGLGLLMSPQAYVLYAGLVVATVLKVYNIRGAILVSIIAASILAHFLGIGDVIEPVELSTEMLEGVLSLNLSTILNPKMWSVILILFILDFYGSIAKFIGLTRNTTIVDQNGDMPKMREALAVDGIGTVVGAGLGTSNVTSYVESAVGIGEGGRTGLTSVVSGLLMLLFLVLIPLVNLVPVVATTGALFFVGLTLFPGRREIQSYSGVDLVAVGLMVLTTIATFGLDKAMLAGFGTFILLQVLTGNWCKINIYLAASTGLLALSVFLN